MVERITPSKALKNIHRSDEHGQSDWREEAHQMQLMYNGYQWPDSDRKKMEDDGRPTAVFNRVAPLIDATIGLELANKKEVKYYARTTQTAIIPDTMNSVAQWVRQESGLEIAEIDAFKDMIITGIGVTATRMTYDDSELGDLSVERINPLHFRWDFKASKRNLQDARWMACYRKMDLEEITALWPEKEEELNSLGSDITQKDGLPSRGHNPQTYNRKESGRDDSADGYKVWEYQYIQLEPYWKIENPFLTLEPEFLSFIQQDILDIFGEDGLKKQLNLSKEGRDKLRKMCKDLNIPDIVEARLNKKVYKKLIFVNDVELQHTDNAVSDITFKVTTGKRDEKDGCWYGVLRGAADPQKWANKFFSTILFTFMHNSKGGVIVTPGAINDPEEFRREWARPDGIITADPDKIREKPQIQMPSMAAEIMKYSIDSIPATSGISPELIAMATQNRSGKLADTRINQSSNLLNDYFESMAQYRKAWGKMLVLFARDYLAQEERLIRLNDNGTAPQFIQLMHDSLADDYDIISEEGSLSITQKQEAWDVLSQLFQGQGIPTPLWKYAPVPQNIANEIMEYMQQAEQSNQQQQGQMAQLQAAQMQADIQKTQALAQNSQARTQKIAVDMEKTKADTHKTQVEAATNLFNGVNAFEPQVQQPRGF